jgi:peptidyl-prolyl cis-trans isomerase A (cyclophilin A)
MATPLPRRVIRFGLSVTAMACAALVGACAKPFPVRQPDPRLLDAAGPDSFTVRFVTSRGPFDVRVHRDWAPRGADRMYYLSRANFFDGVRFFRVVDKFVAQFGLNGDTAVSRAWRGTRIQDDTARKSNVRGTLSFAAGGPNTRTTQMYINFGDNSRLDRTGFAVFGQVISGMDTVVDSIYKGYGEGAPRGQGPSQDSISRQGNAYLIRGFSKLDYVITARVIQEWRHR